MEPVSTARAPATVVIAVGVRLYREDLAAMLNAQGHLRVQGTAPEAQAAVRGLQPDVVIVDVSLAAYPLFAGRSV